MRIPAFPGQRSAPACKAVLSAHLAAPGHLTSAALSPDSVVDAAFVQRTRTSYTPFPHPFIQPTLSSLFTCLCLQARFTSATIAASTWQRRPTSQTPVGAVVFHADDGMVILIKMVVRVHDAPAYLGPRTAASFLRPCVIVHRLTYLPVPPVPFFCPSGGAEWWTGGHYHDALAMGHCK